MKRIDRERGSLPAVLVYGPVVLALAALPVLSSVLGEPVSRFTRDVFSIAEIPVYSGLYSNLGILLWGATSVVLLHTAWLVGGSVGRWGRTRGALLGFGALSGTLMADDFFLVHEWIAPEFLGVPETAVYAAYAVVLAVLLVAYRKEILERRPGHLVVALALFAVSLGMDAFERPPAPAWHYFLEESLKLLGIAAWTVFFVRWASGAALEAPRSG